MLLDHGQLLAKFCHIQQEPIFSSQTDFLPVGFEQPGRQTPGE